VRDWSESLITQASVLPTGKHDDMVDSMTMALKYLRDVGIVQNVEEVLAEENERVVPRSRPKALYPCYRPFCRLLVDYFY
jgi:hypothetical protein